MEQARESQETNEVLKCFVCEKLLEPVFADGGDQPHAGTTFTSRGQYGSTVYDLSLGSDYISLHICDECLIAKQALVKEWKRAPAPLPTGRPWRAPYATVEEWRTDVLEEEK